MLGGGGWGGQVTTGTVYSVTDQSTGTSPIYCYVVCCDNIGHVPVD